MSVHTRFRFFFGAVMFLWEKLKIPSIALIILVVLTGSYCQGNNNHITLDESFATNGKAIANLRGKYHAKTLVIQVDDKIVVGGRGGPNDGFVIGRYKKDGQIDTTFGTNGWLIFPFGKGGVCSLSLQSDQKIIAVGSYKGNFAILRILPDGNPDKSFGFHGMSVTNLGEKDVAWTLGLQRDGKIVVAGSSDDKIVIARYHRTGKLDDTFGSSGVVQHRYSDHSGPIKGHPRALMIQHDEKIIIVGYMGTGILAGHMYFALWRYNQNGKLDSTFGDGGVVLAKARKNNIGTNLALAGGLQKDNKIVIAGTAGAAFVIARFLPNGEYDKSFGNSNGLAKIHFGVRHEVANAVLMQSNGFIIGGGGGGVNHDFALARLLPEGTPDSTFGVDGKITIDMGGVDIAMAMAFQSDGKLVVFGNSDDKFALVRLSE